MESFRLGGVARLESEDVLVFRDRRWKIPLAEEDVPFSKEQLFLGNARGSVREQRVYLRCGNCRSPFSFIRVLQPRKGIGDKWARGIFANDTLVANAGTVIRFEVEEGVAGVEE